MAGCSRKPEIYAVAEGEVYEVNDRCKVWENYIEYNIQVPVERVVTDLLEMGVLKAELKAHTVVPTEESTSEDGKYDVVDTIKVAITGAMASVKEGEVSLERIHIVYGTVTMEGIVTMKVIIGDKEIELVLNEYERIQKADLPFTEEEYRVLVDV